jgi:hypothetical protein
MSEELRVLERWIAFGFFNDTSDLETEIKIAKIADTFFIESPYDTDGLPMKILSVVAAIKIFKELKTEPNVEETHRDIQEFNIIKPYTEDNKKEWMDEFLSSYKEKIKTIQ